VLTYEKVLDETGREMHKSWGNAIELNEALERMGADIARLLFCAAPPSQPLRFGYGMADDVKRRLLTLWNSVSFLVTYANIEGFRPRFADLEQSPDGELRPLDRWLVSRTHQLLADAEREYERYWTPGVVRAFESFVDDLSNWYIRRSRRRFYAYDEAAFRTLWYALVQALRVVSPVTPFLAEHLWLNLVAGPCEDAPRSVFLAGWPAAGEADEALLAEVAETRRVVELGRQARSKAGIRLRQPLRRLVIEGARVDLQGHRDEIADELRVKDAQIGNVRELTRVRLRPNLPVLGPKLGRDLAKVNAALQSWDWDQLEDGRWRVGELVLEPHELLFDISGQAGEGWVHAFDDILAVSLDTALDPELELEGRVLDLIHELNRMRKDAGLELTDRISITLPERHADLLRHADWIKEETLAVSIEANGDAGEPQITRVSGAGGGAAV
jgi:isoleucyl-tRNA synthetase